MLSAEGEGAGAMDEVETVVEEDILDDGPPRKAEQAADPLRRCIASGERLARSGMVRFVLDPQGHVTPDLLARLPGRGMWLSADQGRFKTALEKRSFARAARRPVTVDPDLVERVEDLLLRRVLDLLGLARRSGDAVSGLAKTREAIGRGRVALLLEASDGAREPRDRLARMASGARRIALLTAAELGLAFGRDHAVHGAVNEGGLAHLIAEEAGRLGGFRRPGIED